MNTLALVKELKAKGEDYEFYPTTDAMLARVTGHAESRFRRSSDIRVLDVGAGAGAFLRAWSKVRPQDSLLAIERSTVLMQELVKFAKVIGTDFHQQNFVTKQVDVLFCNPPYSEYEAWTSRLIAECPATDLYFVIPQRWKTDPRIAAAIKSRKAIVSVLGSFDFLDADRAARAKVDVIAVHVKADVDELFTDFFRARFKPEEVSETAQAEALEARNTLVKRDGLIGALVQLYDAELLRLQQSYDAVTSIPARVLADLGLSVQVVAETLRERLSTLRHTYWKEVFSNLDTITDRLTEKNKRAILNGVDGFQQADFTSENVYAVVLWIIEHGNAYVDKQILEVFDALLSEENVIKYKSNARVYDNGDYRYRQEGSKLSHVSLDFRLVVGDGRNYNSTYATVSSHRREFVKDLLVVARLLGFDAVTTDERLLSSAKWTAGKPEMFATEQGDDLLEVRGFKNDNLHLRLSQKFSLALNVAVGKLRGWLRTADEAEEELRADADDCAACFAHSIYASPKTLLLALAPKESV